MKKKLLLLSGVLSFFIITIIVSYLIMMKSSYIRNLNNSYINADINDKTSVIQNHRSLDDLKCISGYELSNSDEILIYDYMHKMANSKIIAEDNLISGQMEISSQRVYDLLSIITKSSFRDKDILLDILNRWKKNDFSIVNEDHNFVWRMLGGTDGKAIGIKKVVNSRNN